MEIVVNQAATLPTLRRMLALNPHRPWRLISVGRALS
jgi:hypothetical protein